MWNFKMLTLLCENVINFPSVKERNTDKEGCWLGGCRLQNVQLGSFKKSD